LPCAVVTVPVARLSQRDYTVRPNSVSLCLHPDLINVYTFNGTGSDKAFAAAMR